MLRYTSLFLVLLAGCCRSTPAIPQRTLEEGVITKITFVNIVAERWGDSSFEVAVKIGERTETFKVERLLFRKLDGTFDELHVGLNIEVEIDGAIRRLRFAEPVGLARHKP